PPPPSSPLFPYTTLFRSGVAIILLIQIAVTIGRFEAARQTFPPLSASTTDDVRNIGAALFRNYNLPFQIVGVLVLVATVGVVLLDRKSTRLNSSHLVISY